MRMTAIEVEELSNKINQRIFNILKKTSSDLSIGLFYPYKNEVDILGLTKKLEKIKFRCLLPKVISKNKPLQYFIYSQKSTLLEKGFGGIMEPVGSQPEDPDIIIASCSAFNIDGYRVGYGGGFFDRTICKLNNKKKIKTILAAFEMQKTNTQFQESHDEKVDYICTENKTYNI